MRWTLLPVLALAALPLAGETGFRREIFGAAGIGMGWDDEGSIGRGFNGGGGIGYRLTRRFGVEGEVNAFRLRREFGPSIPPLGASGAHVMGNAVLLFGRGPARFFLLGGAGLVHATNPLGASVNSLAIDLGLGTKIYAGRHWIVRPELRLFAGGGAHAIEAPFTDIRLSIGVGYAW